MTIGLRWRVLNALMNATGNDVAGMTLEEIHERRRSLIPPVPVGQELLEAAGRRMFGTPHPAVEVGDDTVRGADDIELPARVYRPRGMPTGRPLLVHYHGGGWVVGGPSQYDWWCSHLAARVGLTVVSVDYRKAPEDKAPTAADDARAAFAWISEHRDRWGVGEPTAVGGDSAGGNLSALVALSARDRGLRLDAQVLVYPGVDLSMSFPSIERLPNEPILTRESMDGFLGHYLDGSGVDPKDPRVSPYWADDHRGLAAALVQTAEFDPLVDEGDAYAEKLRAAGVEVRHTRYVGVPHGFMSLPGMTSQAEQGLAEAVAFLREQLGV